MKRLSKKLFVIFLLSFFCLWPLSSSFSQEVDVGVDIILASQKSSYIDTRLTGIEGQLKSIFRFSSYELYTTRRLVIPMGREEQIALPESKIFLLSPLYFHGRMVVMQAKILSGRRLVVDTQFRVSQGGSFFVGGPQTQKGVIILKVTAY
ncbi:MAG: hypothetical protein JW928_00140 [Candidatus Aureabacteria bacterium]|nr:hypothetical protein [Candidatus Auribacterota bacterium]